MYICSTIFAIRTGTASYQYCKTSLKTKEIRKNSAGKFREKNGQNSGCFKFKALGLSKRISRWSILFLFLLKFHLITSFWQSTTQYPWLLAPQARTYASICYSRVSDVNLGEPWWTGSASPLLGVERNHSYENNKK